MNKAWFASGVPLLWDSTIIGRLNAVTPDRVPLYDHAVKSLTISYVPNSSDGETFAPAFSDAWRLPRLRQLHCLYLTALGMLTVTEPILRRCAATLTTVTFEKSFLGHFAPSHIKREDAAAVRKLNRDGKYLAALARCQRLATLRLRLPLTAAAIEHARDGAHDSVDGTAATTPFPALTRFDGHLAAEALAPLCALIPATTHLRLEMEPSARPFPLSGLLSAGHLPALQVLSLVDVLWTEVQELNALEGGSQLRALCIVFARLNPRLDVDATLPQVLNALLSKLPLLRHLKLSGSATKRPSMLELVGHCSPQLVTLDIGVKCNLTTLAAAKTRPLLPMLRKLKVNDLKGADTIGSSNTESTDR